MGAGHSTGHFQFKATTLFMTYIHDQFVGPQGTCTTLHNFLNHCLPNKCTHMFLSKHTAGQGQSACIPWPPPVSLLWAQGQPASNDSNNQPYAFRRLLPLVVAGLAPSTSKSKSTSKSHCGKHYSTRRLGQDSSTGQGLTPINNAVSPNCNQHFHKAAALQPTTDRPPASIFLNPPLFHVLFKLFTRWLHTVPTTLSTCCRTTQRLGGNLDQ